MRQPTVPPPAAETATVESATVAPAPVLEPGPGRPRRDQILDAAAELFARRGFHGVPITELGAAVGISGPGLYRHFASKEAVLAEMLVGISERLLGGARERLAVAGDPADRLRALVDWHVEFALDHPTLITIQSRDLDALAAPERRRVRRLQRDYVEIWVGAVTAARPGTAETTARSAAHAVLGLINSTPHSAGPSRRATGELLRQMALAALLAPPTLGGT
ncbi:TetR/AcrR family transcriptional regulator [Georgenia sp. TF02-10]|uniref:SACE_7040 family transcriptional regulator n=1 Tax=Georgenia sp. TF02-10 TaxID=2917725 RepID=UPI001FA71F1C|nr:TetR/AcrR family transcriptional regulator [Georgenia sp. TF02-10]UNX53697.1 TetR/AcrR family transcriptional regulator [Georgenia sp. TF02-10]